jgi:predicted Zn-dependent protease with MMP-like domain
LSDSDELFEAYARDALESLPSGLRARMSNVEIVIDDEAPPGQALLGLYQAFRLPGAAAGTRRRCPTRSRSFEVRSFVCMDMTQRRFAGK